MKSEDRDNILAEMENRQKEQIAEIAMKIVIHAGDARNLIMEALDCIGNNQFEQAKDKLKKAQDEIHKAHIVQTEVIQAEAGGKEFSYSMLFTHAQDTIMTICTEFNLTKKLFILFEQVDQRFKKLESGGGEAV